MTASVPLLAVAAAPGLAVALGAGLAAVVAIARRSKLLSILSLVLCSLILPAGGLGWSAALSRAFEATAAVEPSSKATFLADSISRVMEGVALSLAGVLVAAVLAMGAILWVFSRPAPPVPPDRQ